MLTTNSDGGARGNPGKGAIGALVRRGDKILKQVSMRVGDKVTNNFAEYMGLIKALNLALEEKESEVTCYLDSELVVKQLTGEYAVRSLILIPLYSEVKKLEEKFEKVIYKHVSREDHYQKIVDKLLNDCLDSKD
jgi:ribonuclease HI